MNPKIEEKIKSEIKEIVSKGCGHGEDCDPDWMENNLIKLFSEIWEDGKKQERERIIGEIRFMERAGYNTYIVNVTGLKGKKTE